MVLYAFILLVNLALHITGPVMNFMASSGSKTSQQIDALVTVLSEPYKRRLTFIELGRAFV
jgi:hypothetical protein